MKTKTLLLSLLAGAFLCFSNASYAQYHSSSSSSSSSSGDGAFDQGVSIFNVGIGFGSTLGNVVGSGYSSSVSPAFELSYEHGLNEHFGFGLNITYQSATSTISEQNDYYNPSTGTLTSYTYNDVYKVSLLTFCARGAYHFTAGAKFDPYIGLTLGYCTVSESYSTTDQYAAYDGNSGSAASATGIQFGAFLGARYYFSDHIGAWVELQYGSASFDGVSINASNIGNVGLTFKL